MDIVMPLVFSALGVLGGTGAGLILVSGGRWTFKRLLPQWDARYRASSSNALLSAHDIPRPEFVLINLLAIELAKATDATLYDDEEMEFPHIRTFLPVEVGPKATVRIYIREAYGHSEGNEPMKVGRVVFVKNNTQNVCLLNKSEKKFLHRQVADLLERAAKFENEQKRQISSNASLDAITSLLGVEDQPVLAASL